MPGYTEALCPTFYSMPSSFTIVIKNVNYNFNLGGNTQVGIQDKILAFCEIARSKQEIISYFGMKSAKSFTKHYLKPLLESGKLKMTVPDKPKSKNQKYIKA